MSEVTKRDQGSNPEPQPARFFIDTEFIESGPSRPIELLSIGIVCEDGRTLYAVDEGAILANANDWVQENVIPHLGGPRIPRDEIRLAIKQFIGDCKPEFWGYYADYDWVVFCQIFGAMIDLPKGWPMFCRDLKQLCVERGNPKLPKQSTTEHNALNDARWNKQAYEFLMKHYAASQPSVPQLNIDICRCGMCLGDPIHDSWHTRGHAFVSALEPSVPATETTNEQWIRESKPQPTETMALGIINDLLGAVRQKAGAVELLTARLNSWREAIVGSTLAGVPSSQGTPVQWSIEYRNELAFAVVSKWLKRPFDGEETGNFRNLYDWIRAALDKAQERAASQGTGWAEGVCRGCGGFVNSCGHSKMRVYSLNLNDGSGMSQTKCSLCEALPAPPSGETT